MLAKGKLTYEEIAKCVDLPVEEIRNLADLQLAWGNVKPQFCNQYRNFFAAGVLL